MYRILIAIILFMPVILMATSTTSDDTLTAIQIDKSQMFKSHLFQTLNTASMPTKFFFAPSAQVLSSMEVYLAGGSAFGVEEEGGFLGRAGLGIGDVAEVEFSTTQFINQLTGHTTRFPARSFKIALVPERFKRYWFVPNIVAHLRTTSWGSVVDKGHRLSADMRAGYEKTNYGESLTSLSTSSRFTTLYVAAGKECELGGITVGFSLTDVRTKEGWQNIYNNNTYIYDYIKLPKMKKEILKPFGGITINANDKTQIMAEVEAVPQFDYDYKAQKVRIRHAWLGIAGVRFFLTNWFSWDTGVRYQSSFDGIADAEINLAVNLILPLKSTER